MFLHICFRSGRADELRKTSRISHQCIDNLFESKKCSCLEPKICFSKSTRHRTKAGKGAPVSRRGGVMPGPPRPRQHPGPLGECETQGGTERPVCRGAVGPGRGERGPWGNAASATRRVRVSARAVLAQPGGGAVAAPCRQNGSHGTEHSECAGPPSPDLAHFCVLAAHCSVCAGAPGALLLSSATERTWLLSEPGGESEPGTSVASAKRKGSCSRGA